jgi:uncharacterized protein YdhG (YjbR/CyaY superfamily)
MEDYIAGFPSEVQVILRRIEGIVRASAPEAQPALKYGIPTFVLGENLVHFAAFAKHIGWYPTPSVITAFRRELAGYKSAKGSVQFPLDRPVPFALIEEMVQFRLKEVRAAKKCRSKKRSRPGGSRHS